jgi:hypothetical protein
VVKRLWALNHVGIFCIVEEHLELEILQGKHDEVRYEGNTYAPFACDFRWWSLHSHSGLFPPG